MDTKVTSGSPTVPQPASQQAASVESKVAAPEKVETPRPVPAAHTAQKPALKQAIPNSALATYKDQDSGRLIVRVYDRESGDVLVEFPPERAFRPAAAAPGTAPAKPKKSFSV